MKRLLSIVLTITLLLSCCVLALPVASAAPATLDAPGSFTLIDENANLALYLDYTTGIFGVMNQKTGTVWYSNPADRADEAIAITEGKEELNTQVAVKYLTASFSSYTVNSNRASFVTEHNGDDLILSFFFNEPSMNFIIPIKLTLQEEYLRVELMIDKIKELGTSKVLEVNLFQFFGAAGLNDTGYAVLTDGTGSLMEFNKSIPNAYEFGVESECVYYGENPTETARQSGFNWNEPFRLPVYGMVKNGEAYMNIIESGASACELHAYVSRFKNSYNAVYPSINIRDTQVRTNFAGKAGAGFYYTDELPENYVGRFYFLNGEDADYVGIAEKYREYLIENNGMTAVKDGISNSLNISLYGAVKRAKHFLGIPYTGVDPLTTFSEAEELVDRLVADQIDKVYINYLGWADGGLDSTLETSFDPERKLGRKNAVDSLISKVDGISNYYLTFDLDLQSFYSESADVKKFKNTAYGLDSSPVTMFKTGLSTAGSLDKSSISKQLIHPGNMFGYAEAFMNNAAKKAIKSFSFNSVGDTLYCAYNLQNLVTRDEAAVIMHEIFTAAREQVGETGIVNTLGGNAYAAPYVDNIVDAPVYASHNNIALDEIPFYQIVFRGYVNLAGCAVNMNSEQDDLILKLAETGMSLYYQVMDAESTAFQDTDYSGAYACELDDHYDDMVANYKRLKTVYDAVGSSMITDYQIVSDDVRITTFSNGAVVYVNHGEEVVTINGVAINAEDFTVVGGANS